LGDPAIPVQAAVIIGSAMASPAQVRGAEPTGGAEPAWNQVGDRLLEMVPGLVTWIMLFSPAWIPILFRTDGAIAVAVGVLAFDLYWLFRSYTIIRGIYQTYRRMEHDMRTDWLVRCRELEGPAGRVHPLDYFHLCVIPTYTEPYHVLEATVQAIVDANYPTEKKLIGIITRETDKPGWANVAALKKKFGASVGGFYHIKDPLEPGIVVGKSAAMNWGGRWMVRQLTREGYDLEQVLITDLDSDYRVHRQYFAWISYHHALDSEREHVVWQPVPLFHNNIFQVPLAVRVMSGSTSQWQMFLHSRPYRLVCFSSYTCSLQFVHDIGYWDKDVIPEDSRFYWKAFFMFGERFHVRSCYLPLYGDSPKARDYAATLESQYNQIKRWAWGITDVPYVVERLFKHPEIPLGLRLQRFSNLFLNHLNWIFLPVFMIFGASMPIWVSIDFSLTDLGQNLWEVSYVTLVAALSTVVFLIYVEHKLLPPKPASWPPWKRRLMYLQYFSYPVVGLVLSVIPALEAHTRLLLGKYLEYRVTEKG
jgi:cellulose synthase/poly-beta-1,6-N-acetylglucosamine synthase-like glycosyltransferase